MSMETRFAFDSMLVFAWISVFLLAGIYLRARVALIQRFLFPSCLVGGFAGLAAMQTGLVAVDISSLEEFGYHLFNKNAMYVRIWFILLRTLNNFIKNNLSLFF